MSIFKDIWSYVSQAGVTEDLENRTSRKVILTNQITFLACSMTFIQMFMFPTIPMFPLLCAASIAAYAMTYWFNARKWHTVARLYFCFVSCLVIVVTGGLISEDLNTSFKFMLIQAFVIPMVVFDIQESKYQLIGFGIFAISFITFDLFNPEIPMMEGVDISKFDSPQNIIVNGVLCMVTLLLGNRYLQKLNFKSEQKLKNSLALSQKQHEEIVLKNKFIREGISYAQRIQNTVLPKSEDLKVLLPDHFVYFSPKEIIGGDFYWQAEHGDHLLIAAVDCTGHGAPGALISIIGSQMLNKIVKDQGMTDPGEVLEILNLEIIKVLHHDSSVLKDGMDISLLSIDTKKRTVRFAGAKNSLIILKDGEVERIRGERTSIGETHLIADGFTSHEISLSQGDGLYLFTDGVIDQFGGPSNKKVLHKRLYEVLSKNHEYSMEIQLDCIKRWMNMWKAGAEQTDDILMIGLRIDFEHMTQVRSFRRPDSTISDHTSLAS